MSEPIDVREIAQQVLAIAESLQDEKLADVSLAGLVREVSIVEEATTLGQWLAVIHELVGGWSGELMEDPVSSALNPLEVAAIVLLFAPPPNQGLLTRDDVNVLLSMAADGKLEGIV